MDKIPELKRWKENLQHELEKRGHSEEDMIRLIYLCQDCAADIQRASQWISQQSAFVSRIQSICSEEYFTRFEKQPPPRETPVPEMLLETPEQRKQVVRELALSITKPGDEVSDRAILDELKRRNMKLDASNPMATISTILNGFKPQFGKVKDKRGLFIRQQQP